MSEINKYKIKRFKKDILNDIQEDIIEDLEKLNVLTIMDLERINSKDDFKLKMETFLDIILEKPPSDVEHFIESLKEWYSWLYDLIINHNNNLYSLAPLHDDLVRGGVPPLPHRNVTRTELVESVRNKLVDLNPNLYLVLHGMLGCGKTSLATEAINCEEVRDLCKGQIFWITVGSEGEKNITSLQERLNAILPEPEPNLSDDIDVALIRLKKRFSKWEFGKNALIILDDVHSEKVIDFLSVGTKFLITTEDENVISANKKSVTIFVKLPDGFQEEESLTLLASGVGKKSHDLPIHAKMIHKFCKGHPMIVSLVSAQLEDHREQVLADTSRWEYYVKLFSDKKMKRRSLGENGTLNNAIKVSVDSMNSEMIEYFQHFVIFIEDVNIKPEVLSVMWSMDVHEVENLLMEFVRKSLIVRKWNERLKSYVYGMHDLILRYLLHNLDDNYIKTLHRNFVENYMRVCNGDLSTLKIEDNYIFYYIGRHLRNAHMFDYFPRLYFNLEFIEMKLRKAGPADVLMDFKDYRNFIVGHQDGINIEIRNFEKLNCFIRFVESYGSWVHKGLDIAQLALQEHPSSIIYKCGVQLANKRSNKTAYVSFLLGPHNKIKMIPQIIKVKKEISTVCFTDSSQFVLVGTYQGIIELWDLSSKSVRMTYNEHTGFVAMIKLDSTCTKFLSTSTDGAVKIWDLVKETLLGDRSPSPRDRQEYYAELWPSASMEKIGEKSLKTLNHTGPVHCAAFPQHPSSLLIATVSHPSQITLWHDTKIKWSLKEDGAKTCELCHHDQWVVVGGIKTVCIIDVKSSIMKVKFNWCVNFLYAIPEKFGGGLLMVSDDRIDVWIDGPEVKPSILPSEIDSTENYICCSVSYHIALGTDSNNVRICHRNTGKTLKTISDFRVGAQLRSISLTEGALITAFDDKTMFLWPLDEVVLPVSRISWPINSEKPYVARVTLGNSIQVCHGREIISDIPVDGEILKLALSIDGNIIAFVYSHNPIIHITNIKNIDEFIKCDLNLTLPLKFYLFKTDEDEIIVAGHSEHSPVKVWFKESNKTITLGQESIRSKFVVISSNHTLITVSSFFGIHLWNLETGTIEKRLSCCNIGGTEKFSISYNKDIFAVSDGSFIEVVNIKDGRVLKVRELSPVIYCTLSPNGRIFACALDCNIVAVHNRDTKERIDYTVTLKNNSKLIMAVSDNGILCTTTSEPIVAVYTRLGVSCSVLHVSSIQASSSNPYAFSVVDNCGELYILEVSNKNSALFTSQL